MRLKIYGRGCAKCNLLTQHAQAAARELGTAYELENTTDMNEIIDSGITRTPLLAVNDRSVAEGKVPSTGELKRHLI